jgi:LuxR family maltose regulon positive regulatory protein
MARQNLARTIEEAKMAGGPFAFLKMTKSLVEAFWAQGYLKEAIEVCREGLKFIDQNRLRDAPISGEVLLAWCFLLCERYDLSQAEEYLIQGTKLAHEGNVAWVRAWAFYVKLRYLIAQEDLLAADQAAEEADSLFQLSELPVWVVTGISALTTLIWVRLGKLDQAEKHLQKRGIWTESQIRFSYEGEFLSLAALLIAKGDFKTAGGLLDRITAWAEETKQVRTLICAWMLRSMVFTGQKENQKALQSMARAMELAEPEGYLLTILELGVGIGPVLYEAIQRRIHPEYATRLLECIKETHPHPIMGPDMQKGQTRILTALSERELEVLRMVAQGQTNKEIASKLHLSLRTVKFHMTSVFTKLEVENRVQAVARAKLLGILL